jgi:hypothetical protein
MYCACASWQGCRARPITGTLIKAIFPPVRSRRSPRLLREEVDVDRPERSGRRVQPIFRFANDDFNFRPQVVRNSLAAANVILCVRSSSQRHSGYPPLELGSLRPKRAGDPAGGRMSAVGPLFSEPAHLRSPRTKPAPAAFLESRRGRRSTDGTQYFKFGRNDSAWGFLLFKRSEIGRSTPQAKPPTGQHFAQRPAGGLNRPQMPPALRPFCLDNPV